MGSALQIASPPSNRTYDQEPIQIPPHEGPAGRKEGENYGAQADQISTWK